MQDLLFLAHRIPYPPNKGDKIRSYHLLRALSRRYRVFLGAFVDDPADMVHLTALNELCEEVVLVRLAPFWARLRSLRALVSGGPLSVAYFRHPRLTRWVRSILAGREIRRVIAFSSPMGCYVTDLVRSGGARGLMDFVDVDSDKWRQYSLNKPWPASWFYAREAAALLRFEREMSSLFDSSVFVSAAEAEMFRRLAPQAAERITHVENGVDSSYFSPERSYPNPYDPGQRVFVFTGAMDYWANVDAVSWFAEAVFPEIRRREPGACFYIVGTRPTHAVLRLARRPGVVVTGAVDDTRPYLAHALAAVAPLRIARGIQNKVLEAMSMAKPVLASPQALSGLELGSAYPLVAEAASSWIDRARWLLADGGVEKLGSDLREWIRERYDWQSNTLRFCRILEGQPVEADRARL